MTGRLRCGGELTADHTGAAQIQFASPCNGCNGAFCGGGSTSAAPLVQSVSLTPALRGVISGRMGQRVDLSVSRRGLTALCMLLFGPALLVLAIMALVSTHSEAGVLFSAASVAALVLAFTVGGILARRFGHRLIDLNLEI